MNCGDVRLDEYADGELDPAAAAGVEAHLSGCGGCREDLGRTRGLEGLLRKAAPGGALPDADRFLAVLRRRTKRAAWRPALAAAALAAAVLAPFLFRRGADAGERVVVLVSRYAQAPSSEIEARIAAAGPEASAMLERIVLEPETDERSRFAAASLLFKTADAPTRDRVLAAYRPGGRSGASDGWQLGDPGTEDEDVELVPAAISMAMEGEGARALEVLHKLHRLHASARGRIADAVVTLLQSPHPKVQKLALEIARELDLQFPLESLVELLEVPDLGNEALRVLKAQTGEDHGSDRAAWKRALAR